MLDTFSSGVIDDVNTVLAKKGRKKLNKKYVRLEAVSVERGVNGHTTVSLNIYYKECLSVAVSMKVNENTGKVAYTVYG